MGRPRKLGTAYERRRDAKRAKRDQDLALYQFTLTLDEYDRKLLTCQTCGRCWYWPLGARYREEHYMLCSAARPWTPPASWDALPFPVAPAPPKPLPTASPRPLPLRYKPW